jgi:YrbI family 3-deoxy-D-manno-octulosonate 8-phosphate phosphatase
MKISKSLQKKIKGIKLVLTDVDGVLTDGGMYYTKNGDNMKKFFVRDGMGVTLLRKNNIPTIIVTKEKNVIIKKWATAMKIEKLFQGIIEKENILKTVCDDFKVSSKEVSYIGDDINDLGLLNKVGFSVCPKDSALIVQNNCDYICENEGGRGAFRELADIILSQKINIK